MGHVWANHFFNFPLNDLFAHLASDANSQSCHKTPSPHRPKMFLPDSVGREMRLLKATPTGVNLRQEEEERCIKQSQSFTYSSTPSSVETSRRIFAVGISCNEVSEYIIQSRSIGLMTDTFGVANIRIMAVSRMIGIICNRIREQLKIWSVKTRQQSSLNKPLYNECSERAGNIISGGK